MTRGTEACSRGLRSGRVVRGSLTLADPAEGRFSRGRSQAHMALPTVTNKL